MTKQQYKKALQERRIMIVGTKMTRNGWTEFDVYELLKRPNKYGSRMERVEVDCAYSMENGGYKCVAWGTSRTLEIILSIGYKLGLDFNEIRQNYITLN